MQKVSPYSGQIIYRAPSPRMVKKEEPLLVLGQSEGLHLRFRVPVWHKTAMENAKAVKVELSAPQSDDGDSERHFVEQRFTGSLVGWQELPEDPWYGLADLACTSPPWEAVWYLASGGEVLAQPRWWPWLLESPGIQFGFILIALGVSGWTITATVAGRKRVTENRNGSLELESPEEDHLFAEYGGDGAMLRLLGTQLHDAVARRRIDRHLIAAAEWALDRHRARAIRLISAGLHEDNGISENLQQLVDERQSMRLKGSLDPRHQNDLCRFLQVLHAVGGEELELDIPRLLRDLEQNDFGPHFDPELRESVRDGRLPR
ncbi:MAG: hypothetical protein ACOC7K_00705 [bacterium]